MPSRLSTEIVLVLTFLIVAPQSVGAQTPPTRTTPATKGPAAGTTAGGKSPPAAAGEEGVRKAIAAYESALAEGKAEAIAKFWTPEGDYAGPSGRVVNARKALAGGSIDPDGPNLKLKTDSVRMVTPDVAQEDGVYELTPEGQKPIYRGHYSAVWVRQQGNWLLSSLRETISPPPSAATRLAKLGWLVGQWTAENDGTTVTVTSSWIDNKTYLLREIVIERDERVVHRVSQRIAFDPLTRRLKAWSFDASGGLGESFWTRQGETWVVESSGVTPDGQLTTARNVFSDITDDAFVFKAVNTEVGGVSKPGVELHFKRVPDDQ